MKRVWFRWWTGAAGVMPPHRLFGLLLAGWLAVWAESAWCAPTGQLRVAPQLGHSGAVIGLDVSPDGRLLTSGGADRTVRLWDIRQQRELRVLLGHAKGLRHVRFSADGRRLASAGADGTVRLWDVQSGQLQAVLEGHRASVEALAFSPDGRWLASGSLDAAVILWDVASQRRHADLVGHSARVYAVSFTADSRRLVSAAKDETLITWDVQTAQASERTSIDHSSHALAHSPDGRWVAHVGQGHEVVLRNLSDGSVMRWRGHTALVNDLRWSRDSSTLISASLDRTARLWQPGRSEPLRTLQTDSGMLWRAAFAADGGSVFTAHGSKTILQWSLIDGQVMAEFEGRSAKVFALAMAPDGRSLVSAGDRTLTHWRLDDLPRSRSMDSALNGLSSVAVLPQPLSAVYGALDGKLAIRPLERAMRATDEIVLFQQRGPLHAVAVSTDGRWAAAAGQEPGIRLWRPGEAGPPTHLRGHHGPVRALGFLPDGTLLSGGQDKMLRRWQPDGGEMLAQYPGHREAVTALAVDAKGSRWASGSWDKSARSGPTSTPDPSTATSLAAGNAWINAVALSPDGAWLAAGSADRTLRLWSIAQPEVSPRELAGHEAGVQAVAFSRDGNRLFSAGRDTTIRLWDRASGRERLQLVPFEGGGWLAITPEGYFASSGADVEHSLVVRWGSGLDDVTDISAYRERFYRPDIVQRVLDGAEAATNSPRLQDVALAPTVEILPLPAQASTDTVPLGLRLSERGGGIGEVRVSVNGSAVASMAGRAAVVTGPSPTMVVPIRLDPGANLIRVVAFNADGSMRSEPAEARIQAPSGSTQRPTMHVLAVGIDQFLNPRLALRHAVADAQAVAATLRERSAGLFARVEVSELTTPEQTTREALLQALRRHASLRPSDVFVMFVASHGMMQGESLDRQSYFLLTSNVGSTSPAALARDAIGQAELRAALTAIPARKKLIILDTCHAGALGESLQGLGVGSRGLAEDAALRILGEAMGSTILAAASSVQQALEGYQGHGLFSWVLMQGLRGKAESGGRGYVSTADLSSYIEDEVPRLAMSAFRAAQYPVPINSGRPFPLTLLRAGAVPADEPTPPRTGVRPDLGDPAEVPSD